MINMLSSTSHRNASISSSAYFDAMDEPLSDPELWPHDIKKNVDILSEKEKEMVKMLLSIQQHHVFNNWEDVGVNDELKHQFFAQIDRLHSAYPSPGGLIDYIKNARELLGNAKNGFNPLQGYKPTIPTGEILEPLTDRFMQLEQLGIGELGRVGFILVAGGLGERLGYHGIKVSLPSETTTKTSYLELYCQSILAIQKRYGVGIPLPLTIMTSDDTHALTVKLLEDHQFFGLQPSQVTILKQEKVSALMDNMAHLSRASTYEIDCKPHGHGDIHSLMYSSGTASRWLQSGIKWILFFQDTNALTFYSLAVQLGVSVSLELEVNSMAIPRIAKQAIGAITRLERESDGSSITVNVEYNQLDPLLRSCGFEEGDINDVTTGFSPFPGNINQLLFLLEPYVKNIEANHGIMSEFVNPKYADKDRIQFKKPTRLECMMQDYPKTLKDSAKVGFTMAPAWICYSPCKNNTIDAAAAFATGIPANSAFTSESDQYNVFTELLKKMGVSTTQGNPMTIAGITATTGPQIVIKPSAAIFATELMQIFPTPRKVSISSSSSLVMEGNVVLHSLELDGALKLVATPGTKLVVRAGLTHGGIHNEGQRITIIDSKLPEAAALDEVDLMRGYIYVMKKQEVILTPTASSSLSLSGGRSEESSHNDEVSVYNGRMLIPGSAYDDDEDELNLSSGQQSCISCFARTTIC